MPRPRKLYDAAALAEERGFLEEFPQTLVDSNPWAGLSVPTKEIYELLLSRWEEYLSKYVPNGVPAGQAPDIDRLKHFMKWLAFSIRGVLDEQPTIASLLTCWARFSTVCYRKYNIRIDTSSQREMKHYITEILPTQTNVLNIQKEQGTVAPQDRSDLLESIWKEDIHTYPHPRLLVSISAFWILVWCTAARVGTALESNCYRGSNQALRYKDLKIMVVSGSTPQEGTILLCAVQFSWQKGQRENRNSALPELEFKTKLKNLKKGVVLNSRAPTPPFYEPEKLCDNFLLYIFAHALADDAFKTIRSVQDVSNLQPPPGRNALELNWKETALELPVFRMVTPERVTDNALSVGALYTFLHGHQDRFGYMKHVTIHAVRRHAGTVLDGITTEAARMHHMGQKSKPIFSDCYVDNVPHFDLQAAIFSEESHLDDISQLRRLGNYRDTRLPTDLSAEEERKFNQMPEVATLNNEIQTLTAADDIKHNKKLYQHRQELYSKKARLRKAAVDELRQRCFDGDSVYTPLLEANQQLRKETLAVVMKLLPERDRLSRMLFTKAKIRSEAGTQALTDLATLCAQGDHARVLYRPGESPINGHCPICDKAMLELCPESRSRHIHLCESRRLQQTTTKKVISDPILRRVHRNYKNTFVEYCYICCQWMKDVETWEKHWEEEHLASDKLLFRCGILTYRYTLIFPGFCPFCLGDESKRASVRCKQWMHKKSLFVHIDEHLTACGGTPPCPHPLCQRKYRFQDPQLLKDHFQDVHALEPSKTGMPSHQVTGYSKRKREGESSSLEGKKPKK